jgi:hypothetical protein
VVFVLGMLYIHIKKRKGKNNRCVHKKSINRPITVFDIKDMYGILGIAVFVQAYIHNRSWQMIKRGLTFKGTLTEFKDYISYEHLVIKKILRSFFRNIST